MKAHLLELYSGVTARNSFVGPDRQIVDCIPIDQQPGLRPPGRPRAELSRDVKQSTAAAPEVRGDADLCGRRLSEDITLKSGQRDGPSSKSARLVPCTTLPSMQRLSPSGLMISPQSWATANLRAHTLPLRRSTSTSATIAISAPERCA